MIGIIGAMQEEIELFKNHLTEIQEIQSANLQILKGILHEKKVAVVKCGVGKVNAAMCAQILIDQFACNPVIMTGVAGGISRHLKTGDIFIGKTVVQHDMNAIGLGFKQGQIPFTEDRIFTASKKLTELAEKAGKTLGLKTHTGTMATGDLFVQKEKHTENIVKQFNAKALDMEAGALAQVCTYNQIDFLVIKAISDSADENAAKNFNTFLNKAAENSFQLVKELIQKL